MNIGRLASPIIAIAKASSAAHELFATIDAPAPDTSGLKEPEITADTNITFENVAFSYPSRPNVQILKGLDLSIGAGKTTAIVGPSGSGKSTVVGLVQRWYELHGTTALETLADKIEDSETPESSAKKEEKPKKSKWFGKGDTPEANVEKDATKKKSDPSKKGEEEVDLRPNTCTGTIRIGETDLRKVDLKWWRSQIGLVQQEPFLFNDTLYSMSPSTFKVEHTLTCRFRS